MGGESVVMLSPPFTHRRRTVMRIESTQKVLYRALGMFEAYRRLGFSADDIFISFNALKRRNTYQVLQELHTQEKAFRVSCGVVHGSQENLIQTWMKLGEWWNHGAQEEERQKIYDVAWPELKVSHAGLVGAILAKGLVIPPQSKKEEKS